MMEKQIGNGVYIHTNRMIIKINLKVGRYRS